MSDDDTNLSQIKTKHFFNDEHQPEKQTSDEKEINKIKCKKKLVFQ